MIEVGHSGVGLEKMMVDPAVSILTVHMPIKLLYLYQIQKHENHLAVVFK